MFDFLLRISLGIGSTVVGSEWNRKSMSVERTFRPTQDLNSVKQKLHELSEKLAEDLAVEHLKVQFLCLLAN